MRLTLNDQATEQFLALMRIHGFTNPTYAINRLVTQMFNNAQSSTPANPNEVIYDQQVHRTNAD